MGAPGTTAAACASGMSTFTHTVREPVDAKEHRAGHDGHPLARAQLAHDAVHGRGERHVRARLAVPLHVRDLLLGHVEEEQAVARRARELLRARRLAAAKREVFLLRAGPVRHEELRERLALAHGVERRAHEELLDIAGRARLHEGDRALVEGDGADRLDGDREPPLLRDRGAHAQVLHHARAHLHAARVGAVVRVDGHEVHVHEGRAAGLVELLRRVHRVVPVEDLASALGLLRGGGVGGGRGVHRALRVPVAAETAGGEEGRTDGGDEGAVHFGFLSTSR